MMPFALLMTLLFATPAAAMFASPAPPLPDSIQPAPSPTRVPEPGTLALVALGLGFAAWQVRRRRG